MPTKKHKPRPTKKHPPKRTKVIVRYQRVRKSPSEREQRPLEIVDGATLDYRNKRSPLIRYILDNEGSGLPLSELIAQFQEYDCRHEMEPYASTPDTVTKRCKTCWKMDTKVRAGRE